MPIELQIEQPTEAAFQSQDDYVETTSERMRAAYAIVRDHLGASFSRAKKSTMKGLKPFASKLAILCGIIYPEIVKA